ncbi:actin-10-related [Anaeramoeba ignava]|uniref:Actin-10-related n=1 Tax=Anaeramoeba ignava TaxID=1746090 RepID=A0A9Q0LXB7_ANAIG|nr:actin-10-related [Anaeramoeba ignava]
MENEIPSIVIDNGTFSIKSGISGDDHPKKIFHSIVGRPKTNNEMIKFRNKEYIGDEAQSQREVLSLSYPIKRRIIRNWDDMEKIWNYTFFNQLRIPPEEHAILLTEHPLNPKENREKTTQIMFEIFNTPAFYIINQGTLSQYASGRNTGFIVDFGHEEIFFAPNYSGTILPHLVTTLELGGKDLTDYLMKILNEKEIQFQISETEIVRDIKEKLSYVADDFNQEMNKEEKLIQKNYELPDGKIMAFGNELFKCLEPLFHPSLIGLEKPGISEIIFNTIKRSDNDIQKDFSANIILSGASSNFPGIANRLQKEVSQLSSSVMRFKVIPPPEREYSVWIGGSILSSLSTFENMWISKEEYQENGASIVHKKCF